MPKNHKPIVFLNKKLKYYTWSKKIVLTQFEPMTVRILVQGFVHSDTWANGVISLASCVLFETKTCNNENLPTSKIYLGLHELHNGEAMLHLLHTSYATTDT